jgi:uncharacterized protein (DUF736 family)
VKVTVSLHLLCVDLDLVAEELSAFQQQPDADVLVEAMDIAEAWAATPSESRPSFLVCVPPE